MDVPKASPGLEPSLTNMILNQKSQRIRRPPNAFMVFAKEHRKSVSKKNPDVSNKIISKLLGQIWKGAPEAVKQKYYKKAKMLNELHQAQYPGYVYSPREARIQKAKKMKIKNGPKIKTERSPEFRNAENQLTDDKNQDEDDWVIVTSNDEKSSSPGYVPNNPEYFTSEDTSNDESSALDPLSPKQRPTESEYSHERPRGSEYSCGGANESEYSRRGPNEPEYFCREPNESEYSRGEPSEPEYSRGGPYEPKYSRGGLNEPKYSHGGPIESEYSLGGPNETEYSSGGPSESEYSRGNPQNEEEEEEEEVHPEMYYRWFRRPGRYGYYNANRKEPRSRSMTPFDDREEEGPIHLQDHLQCPFPPTSSFYNPTRPFKGRINPLYYGTRYNGPMPGMYKSSFQPYWSPSTMNARYYQPQDSIYEEDCKPYLFPPPYAFAPDYYPQRFPRFDRPLLRRKISPTSGLSRFDENWDRTSNYISDGYGTGNKESHYPYLKKASKIDQNIPRTVTPTRNEDGMCLRNRKIIRSGTKDNEQSMRFCKSDSGKQISSPLTLASDRVSPVNISKNPHERNSQLHSQVIQPQNDIAIFREYSDHSSLDFTTDVHYRSATDATRYYRNRMNPHFESVPSSNRLTPPDSTGAALRNIAISNQYSINIDADNCGNVSDSISCNEPEGYESGNENLNSGTVTVCNEVATTYSESTAGDDSQSISSSQESQTQNEALMVQIKEESSDMDLLTKCGNSCQRDFIEYEDTSSVPMDCTKEMVIGETSRFSEDNRNFLTLRDSPRATVTVPSSCGFTTKPGFHSSSPISTVALYGNQIHYRKGVVNNFIRKPAVLVENRPYFSVGVNINESEEEEFNTKEQDKYGKVEFYSDDLLEKPNATSNAFVNRTHISKIQAGESFNRAYTTQQKHPGMDAFKSKASYPTVNETIVKQDIEGERFDSSVILPFVKEETRILHSE